jgi:hypothetical protein
VVVVVVVVVVSVEVVVAAAVVVVVEVAVVVVVGSGVGGEGRPGRAACAAHACLHNAVHVSCCSFSRFATGLRPTSTHPPTPMHCCTSNWFELMTDAMTTCHNSYKVQGHHQRRRGGTDGQRRDWLVRLRGLPGSRGGRQQGEGCCRSSQSGAWSVRAGAEQLQERVDASACSKTLTHMHSVGVVCVASPALLSMSPTAVFTACVHLRLYHAHTCARRQARRSARRNGGGSEQVGASDTTARPKERAKDK